MTKRSNGDLLHIAATNPRKGSHTSWGTLEMHLKAFTRGESLPSSSITPKWIYAFQAYLLMGRSNNTVRQYLALLSVLLDDAVEAGFIRTNPARTIGTSQRVKEKVQEVPFLTTADLRRLDSCIPIARPIRLAGISLPQGPIPAEVRQCFLLCCLTGLRMNEVFGLRWNQVKATGKGRGRQYYIMLPDRQNGELQISRAAHQILIRHRKETSGGLRSLAFPMLAKCIGNIEQQNKVTRLLRQWGQAAGVAAKLDQNLPRSTFAVLSLAAGFTIPELMHSLGLASPQSILKYQVTVDALRYHGRRIRLLNKGGGYQ